jgi:transposase
LKKAALGAQRAIRSNVVAKMRGEKQKQVNVACLINVETMIPADHPIRVIKRVLGEVLGRMDELFDQMYAAKGRPSIPPERLLLAKVLMALYSIRSERQFCERLQYDLLFRWFLDLNPDETSFDHSSFSQNQARLLQHEVADVFFRQVVAVAQAQGWVSDQHFSVDATLIDAWASLKSFKRKDGGDGPGDGNGWGGFQGEKRSNATHESKTDPDAKLARRGGGEARLAFAGHATMENRHGLCVLFEVHPAAGAPEADVAVAQIAKLQQRGLHPDTVGADRGYCSRPFIEGLRGHGVVPHPAPMARRQLLGVKVRSRAHQLSQKCRRKIEEIFGWAKTTGCFRKSRYLGVARTHAAGQYVVATYNLIRLARLSLGPPPPARA